MPEVRRQASTRAAALEATEGVELLPRPLVLAGRLELGASSASRSSTSTSTSRAAYSSHGSGSGRVDQSTAECSFFIRQPSSVSTRVASPTRG